MKQLAILAALAIAMLHQAIVNQSPITMARRGGSATTTTTTTTTVPPSTLANPCPDGQGCIAAGFNHALILRADGSVDATGSNDSGQLGQGNTTASNLFEKVKDPTGAGFLSNICAVAVSGVAGNGSTTDYGDSYALACNGVVYTWGRNNAGQGCLGNYTQHTLPVQMPTYTDVNAITGGSENMVFIRTDASVWGCGRNQEGELGLGTDSGSPNTPQQTQNTTNSGPFVNAVGLAMGNRHLILLNNLSSLYINGPNDHGQIGQNNCSGPYAPCTSNPGPNTYDNPIKPLNDDGSPVGSVTYLGANAESNFTCVIESNSVRCEGANKHQNLGLNTTTDPILEFTVPHSESGSGQLSNVTKIAVGGFHVLYVKGDGTAGMWGQNLNGESCNGGSPGSPANYGNATLQTGMAGAHQVYAGSHTSFFYDGSNYKACGSNSRGQLGIGTNSDTATATTIALP